MIYIDILFSIDIKSAPNAETIIIYLQIFIQQQTYVYIITHFHPTISEISPTGNPKHPTSNPTKSIEEDIEKITLSQGDSRRTNSLFLPVMPELTGRTSEQEELFPFLWCCSSNNFPTFSLFFFIPPLSLVAFLRMEDQILQQQPRSGGKVG
ncbi:hypothetical protein CEXT_683611 [Caerostris extrusa]|uniref:Uncharacterized protein n=1 Tax=Caerostris extrusa TaxID=172846 RepID=A0AAV4PR05_CAEEX|nr:hypothetical protein CEXT_683611 [Caerostris extrusa]